jgi:hypothetical protein
VLWQHNPIEVEAALAGAPGRPPFPPITDRLAWEQVRATIGSVEAAALIARAESAAATPVPSLPATLFLQFQRAGERPGYETPNHARRSSLAALVLAECLEDQGRFLDPILDYAWAICEESTWVWPAHQSSLTDIQRFYLDLGAASTALTLAEASYLVGVRLDLLLAKRIRDEVDRRCLAPFLSRHDLWWMFNSAQHPVNNWTAVCVGGVVGAACYLEADNARLAEIIARGARSLTDYLATFDEDGGSSEGPGYWSYGFGLFTIVSHLVENRTGGQVCFLAGDQIQAIARYPVRTLLSPSVYVNFSDCDRDVRLIAPHLAYLAQRLAIPELGVLARSPVAEHQQHFPWGLRDLFWRPESDEQPLTLARDDFFRGMQWLIARDDPSDPNALVLAVKGGHNGEMHNQNDVGNVIVHVNQESLVADLGRGRYTRAYFGPERYEHLVNSSRGHSVPVVNGQLQEPGRERAAGFLARETSDQHSSLRLDLKAAYPPTADLASLERTVTLHREPSGGRVTLEDRVCFATRPGQFESVLTTFGAVEIGDDSVRIRGERGQLLVSFDPQVVTPRVEDIPDVDFDDGPVAVRRIVFALREPALEATVVLEMQESNP